MVRIKLKRELKRWNKSSFGNSREIIKKMEKKITMIQNLEPTKELELEASLPLELKISGWLGRI